MSRSPTEYTPVASSRTLTAGTSSVVSTPSRSSTAPQLHPAGESLHADPGPSVPVAMSPTIQKAPASKRTFSNASLTRYLSEKSGNGPQLETAYQRRNASDSSAPTPNSTWFPKSPSVLSDLTLSTSDSSGSYSSADPPRLELDFFTTSPTGVEALGIPLHLASPLSVDSRRLGAIQEATLSPYSILNIVDDVVESGTLEGLVQHLIKRFGGQ